MELIHPTYNWFLGPLFLEVLDHGELGSLGLASHRKDSHPFQHVLTGLCLVMQMSNTRWWFQISFYLHPYLGNISNLTCAYFSNGLVQPPTRIDHHFPCYLDVPGR